MLGLSIFIGIDFRNENAGGTVIPFWCSLLNILSTELNEQSIFLIFDFLGRG